MSQPTIKIGVVGFSRNQFDQKAAHQQLKTILHFLSKDTRPDSVELVSGYTNTGVPKIAYQIADDMGLITVGFSAKQALRVKNGLYPVQKNIIFGSKFGDESEAFVAYIDLLIRVGGGPQSRREVALFKDLNQEKDLSKILFESEVEWYGK